ncbi:MAG: endonuclease/exonuclease/phosphatase family protein, partial [Bacteroidales bacterium]|nr:endonuclease/exonuclease/phosphatase family protein [Bacteroidales bacterium]
FLILWLVKWKKAVLIPLITISLGLNHIYHAGPALRIKRDLHEKKGDDLKILSYNVRAFNIYDWENDPNTDEGIFNFIRSEHPDVICLQEFYYNRGSSQPASTPRFFREIPYQHIQYTSRNSSSGFGIATFSKYPIVKTGTIRFDKSNNLAIYTDILFHNDTIRIFNNHLQSVNFLQNNYRFIEKIPVVSSDRNIEEIKDISSKLKSAFIKRAKQTDKIKARINQSPYPVIVCGDFNDTPVSYAYHKMQKRLDDAFLKAGTGRGNTHLGKIPLRIDYIHYSKEFEAVEFEKIKADLSDHYPIISVLRF